MSAGDWIALAALGVTGTAMFAGLLSAIWKSAAKLEKRFGELSERLTKLEIQFARGAQQSQQSTLRFLRGVD